MHNWDRQLHVAINAIQFGGSVIVVCGGNRSSFAHNNVNDDVRKRWPGNTRTGFLMGMSLNEFG